MSEKNIKKIGIRDALGEYIYTDIGVDADKVDIDVSTNLAEKLVEIDNKFEDLKAGGYASKDIYGDEKINLGRKVGTSAGPYSVTIGRDVSATGTCSLAEGNGTAASGNYSHSEGYGTIAGGENSHSEGYGTIAGGENSHSEGYGTIASGQTQHVQGRYNVEDTNDRYAHIVGGGSRMERKNIHTLDWYGNAEFAGDVQGYDSTTGKKVSLLDKATIYGDTTINVGRKENSTVGEYSTAEGYDTIASGGASHSEGTGTTAKGGYSHSEGNSTTAIGDGSHSEGYATTAGGNASHSEGYGTIASGQTQHVQGRYNVEDTNDRYAHIVGGGTYRERKNIHTLDWLGNAEFAGDVIIHDLDGNAISLVNAISLINTALTNANLL